MIRPGDRLGHVRVEAPLAEGGMGAVYAGFDEMLARPVALKALRADRLDATARARFLTEARVLSQLDHPNVCRIHGFLETDQGDFLVLERIAGRTLREALAAGLTRATKLLVAESVARALEVAHERGIVHRDLKPDNVMLTREGQVKVLDFGLARLVGDESAGTAASFREPTATSWWPSPGGHTTVGHLVGTPASMSPEQARGEPATAASDVYALGLMLQELFTERPPYEAGLSVPLLLVKAAEGDTLPLENLPSDLSALIRRMKAVAPDARPTAAEVAVRIARIRGRPRRRRLGVGAAVVVATFLAGGFKYTLDLRQERHNAFEAHRAAALEAAHAEATARFLEELFRASDPRQARGHVPDAHELLRRGTERLGRDAGLGDQPLLRARLLETLGGIHTELGLYDEARPLLESALEIRQGLPPNEDAAVAETLVRLGSLAQLSGRGDAADYFRRALALRLRRWGPADSKVADTLNKLGLTLASRGNLDGAEGLLRRSLALHQRLWGEADPRIAKVLHNLSGIAYYRQRTAEGEALLRRALAIREASSPPDDPELAGSREALALLVLQRGEAGEAEELLERVRTTTEAIYGARHPEVARALLNLGLARQALGRHGEARRLIERALAIAEAALEPGHPLRRRITDTLASTAPR